MSLRGLTLGLLSACSLGGIEVLFAFPVAAQCIQADVSVQYNISGSQEPTDRTNDVDFQSQGSCRGNASVTTSVQGNEGGRGKVRQNRVVRHRFANSGSQTNSRGSTIQIRSNPTIDVYNAADNLEY